MKKAIKVLLTLVAFNLFTWLVFAYISNDLKWFNDWIYPNDKLSYLEITNIILYFANNFVLLASSIILIKKMKKNIVI